MPKETVHWGKQYLSVLHPGNENVGEHRFEEKFTGFSINSKNEPESLPEGTVLSRHPCVDVVWVRPEERAPVAYDEVPEGYVQIGMKFDKFDLDESLKWSDDSLTVEFFTQAMSRSELNNMIKTLKRARDAAYGADE